MAIPTEPIGSIPRPLKLLHAIKQRGGSAPESGTTVRGSKGKVEAWVWSFRDVSVAKPVEPAELLAVVNSLAGRKGRPLARCRLASILSGSLLNSGGLLIAPANRHMLVRIR